MLISSRYGVPFCYIKKLQDWHFYDSHMFSNYTNFLKVHISNLLNPENIYSIPWFIIQKPAFWHFRKTYSSLLAKYVLFFPKKIFQEVNLFSSKDQQQRTGCVIVIGHNHLNIMTNQVTDPHSSWWREDVVQTFHEYKETHQQKNGPDGSLYRGWFWKQTGAIRFLVMPFMTAQ